MKFSVSVQFELPHVVLHPSLVSVQEAVSFMAQEMIEVASSVRWCNEKAREEFMIAMKTSEDIVSVKEKIDNSVLGKYKVCY